MVRIDSRRGCALARAQVGDIVRGTAFMPFHYGYFDGNNAQRAANELTATQWDPTSKQPLYKVVPVRISKHQDTLVNRGIDAIEVASEVAGAQFSNLISPMKTAPKMHIALYVAQTTESLSHMVSVFKEIESRHSDDPEVMSGLKTFTERFQFHIHDTGDLTTKYGSRGGPDPRRLKMALFRGKRKGQLGAMRDINDLHIWSAQISTCAATLRQGLRALRDEMSQSRIGALQVTLTQFEQWLRTLVITRAGQVLVAS